MSEPDYTKNTAADVSAPRSGTQEGKYRKRPVIVDAIRIWANSVWPSEVRYDENQGGFAVYDKLHDTWVHFESGDWIITGIQGEKYPCKPDIFEETYELAASNSSLTAETQWDEKELKVIADLSYKLDISEEAVMRAALRTYQMVQFGLFELPEINPKSKLAEEAAPPVDKEGRP